MNIQIATLFSFLLIVAPLAGCTKSNKEGDPSQTPSSLEGKTLVGTVTLGTGVFAGMEGYSFKTALLKGQAFKTTSAQNATDSQGEYVYTKVDNSTGRLTLTDRSSLHSGLQIDVTLRFTSANSGTYDSRFLSGQSGEQNGTFELK